MILIYNILFITVFLICFPFFLLISCIDKRFRSGFRERLGLLPKNIKNTNGDTIWVHCASVGEVQTVVMFVNTIIERDLAKNIFITTMTQTGNKVVKNKIPNIKNVSLLPFDLPWGYKIFFRNLKPKVLILVESELWPNLLRSAKRNGVNTILINGSISKRSYKRFLIIKPFIKTILSFLDYLAVQTKNDRERFLSLGASEDKVFVTGNMKYDHFLKVDSKNDPPTEFSNFISKSKLLIAGSTHKGEEEIILDSFNTLKSLHPDLKLVIAPRYIKRVKQIEAIIKNRGWTSSRYSDIISGIALNNSILILDIMGELPKLYKFADAVVVGGSFIPIGGHNVIEPAIYGKPVFFGPHTDEISSSRDILVKIGIGKSVNGASELASALSDTINDSKNQILNEKEVLYALEKMKGATNKNFEILKKFILKDALSTT